MREGGVRAYRLQEEEVARLLTGVRERERGSERDEKEGRKKQGQTNNKAKQHSTPKAVTFPRKMSCLGWDSNPRHSTL